MNILAFLLTVFNGLLACWNKKSKICWNEQWNMAFNLSYFCCCLIYKKFSKDCITIKHPTGIYLFQVNNGNANQLLFFCDDFDFNRQFPETIVSLFALRLSGEKFFFLNIRSGLSWVNRENFNWFQNVFLVIFRGCQRAKFW